MIGPVDFASSSLDEEKIVEATSKAKHMKTVTPRKGFVFRRVLLASAIVAGGTFGIMTYADVSPFNTIASVVQAESTPGEVSFNPLEFVAGRREAVWTAPDGSSVEDNARKLFEYEKEVLSKGEDAIVVTGKPVDTVATFGVVQRATYRCNSAERVAESSSANAIKVDVHQAVGSDDAQLYTDEYAGYTLAAFLTTCKDTGKVAILDLHDDANEEAVVKAVSSAGLFENTRFIVSDMEQARRLHDINEGCVCWLRSSSGTSGEAYNILTAGKGEWLISGIFVMSDEVPSEGVKGFVEAIHAKNNSVGKPMQVCVCSTSIDMDMAALSSWESAGADVLMTYKVG